MSVQRNEALPKIGVDMFYYAPLTADPVDGPATYGPSVRIPGLTQVGYNQNAQSSAFYADNGPYATATQRGDLAAQCGMADVPPEVRAEWFGDSYENGLLEEGDLASIDIAIAFRYKKSSNAYRYVWIYKTKATPPDESVNTQGNNVAFQGGTVNFTASKLVATNKARRVLDDDDKNLPVGVTPEIIAENWFSNPLWVVEVSG